MVMKMNSLKEFVKQFDSNKKVKVGKKSSINGNIYFDTYTVGEVEMLPFYGYYVVDNYEERGNIYIVCEVIHNDGSV